MKTDLELALECAINIYHQYAIKNPIDDYLDKSEFSQLLKETAKPFLHNTTPVRAKHRPGFKSSKWPPWAMGVAGSSQSPFSLGFS